MELVTSRYVVSTELWIEHRLRLTVPSPFTEALPQPARQGFYLNFFLNRPAWDLQSP